MIKHLFKSKSNFVILLIFHLLFLAIVVANFPLGKWFVGWDSIHPEFNFGLNFSRALFAGGWQENYGVGTLTGHGFAALLVHTIITFLLSLIMPLTAIRPAITLLCLYLGGLGLYFLVRTLLNLIVKYYRAQFWQERSDVLSGIALLASLYYMFNLATVQIFYVQLEAFIVHFAALPWLFLSTINLLQERSRKNILFFATVNLLATVQGFIPPLFVAYATALALFLLIYVISQRWSKTALKSGALIVLLTFFINAFWFLPVAYFTATRGSTYLNSYNNLISTPQFVQESQKFGDLEDAALLKGFYWDSYELGGAILTPWIAHQRGAIPLIGYLVFGIAAVGLFAGLFLIRYWVVKAFSLIGLYFFVSLAVATPPFSWITFILQWLSPTYNQAFRAAFTKFGLGNGFVYSILFAIGLLFLVNAAYKVFRYKIVLQGTLVILGLGLVCYAWPLFQGNLMYKKLLVNVPKPYFEIIDYFKNQGDGRIADFPQDCPEGWYSYQWGYFGSGFLWYGIRQPILARSFDVWSRYNENYYWEVIQAIREKDFNRVEKIFDKYGVKWLLYDQNFIYCRNQHSVFATNDFIKYAESSPNYHLVKKFETEGSLPIKLYERTNGAGSYVGTANDLQNVGPAYTFSDQDTAFSDYGVYLTSSKSHYNAYYPFEVLFSKRGLTDQKEFAVTANENEIALGYKIPKDLQGDSMRLPAYSTLEKYIPVVLRLNHLSGVTYEATLTYQLPEISIDGQLLSNPPPTISLSKVLIRDLKNTSIYINNIKIEQNNDKYQSVFLFGQENTIRVVGGNQTVLAWTDRQNSSNQLFNKDIIITLPSFAKGELQVKIPKIKGDDIHGVNKISNISTFVPEPCNEPVPSGRNKHEYGVENEKDYVRMISLDSRQCLIVPSELSTAVGYVFEIKARHVLGGNLMLSVNNKNQPVGLDIYIPKDRKFTPHYFILPPTLPSEIGYNFVFQNASFNNELMINDIAGITAWYLPYNYLKSIKVERLGFEGIAGQLSPVVMQPVSAVHPNDTFYQVRVDPNKISYLLLAQGFDEGWLGFVSPLRLLSNHVLINNWMNGWDVSELKEQGREVMITIIFLPQYLEYFGFILLPLPFIYVLIAQKRNK